MSIRSIIEEKRKWRAYKARIESLPEDYKTVYKEIEKYLFKVGVIDLAELGDGADAGILSGVLGLFEEAAGRGKGVLEITGSDVARFCDDLIKDSKTYLDTYQEDGN